MGYADLSSAAAQLNLDLAAAADADKIALLAECDDAVSRLFERKAGYDAAQSPIWRGTDATIPAVSRNVWGEINASDVLMLPVPATTLTDVQVAGYSPETLVAADWMAWNASSLSVARSVRRLDGSAWPVRPSQTYVTVTGHWADGPQAADPPELVIAACTFLAVEEYRMRTMSPAGEIGPEGLSIRPRNPWAYQLVTGAIESVKVAMPAAVF